MPSLFKYLSLITLLFTLSGCMVGPNFHTPAKPAVASFTAYPLPKHTAKAKTLKNAGKSQRFIDVDNLPDEWWTLFHSPTVNQLVAEGITHSPTLSSAYATLRQAQEAWRAQLGTAFFPAVSAVGTGERQLSPATTGPLGQSQKNIFNLFTASANVSYTLDIFGGARRQSESLAAQIDYQQFQLIAAYLSLTSNIVNTAINIASLNEQIKITRALIREETDLLHTIQQQYRLGAISKLNVLTQETQVDQIRATLPPLQKSLAQNQHALDVLIGSYPNQRVPVIHLDALVLPKNLPVTLPSNLVRQRPDVRASEALLHAASAQIGVATANLLPQLTLNASDGFESVIASQLFTKKNNVWSWGGTLTQPLFQGGALLANRRGAIDAYEAAQAQYQQTVLQAFQNVADVLRALETDARTLRENRAAEVAAKENYQLTKQQYLLGGVSYINLLTAEQAYQQTIIGRIGAEANRYTDTVALFQALGGGWWNKPWCVKECFDERG